MTDTRLQDIVDEIMAVDPTAVGQLKHNKYGGQRNRDLIGTLTSAKFNSIEELVAESDTLDIADFANVEIVNDNKVTIIDEEDSEAGVASNGDPEKLRSSKITELPIGSLKLRESLKRNNPDALKKLIRVVEKTGFVSPIIANQNLEVIDGELRLEAAKKAKLDTVPVMLVNADDKVSTFLRIVLNRSSEFQRWNFNEVDAFADANLEMTGYLEPYGVFSSQIVPKTFLGDTVKNYEISEHNDQQKFYTQSIGLSEWARRIREASLEPEVKRPQKKTIKNTEPTFSLFDEEDLAGAQEPGTDPNTIVENSVKEQRDEADTITTNYDEYRGEAAEQQRRRRSSKEKTRDNKLAAESIDQDEESELD